MGNTAIQVDHLSKQYRIGSLQQGGSKYKSLREELTKAVRAPIRRTGRLLRGEPYGAAELDETIWALKDVSFEVKHGEVLGIIGANGAGKTTLLKILSRITEPTEGRAVLHGRVGSLLEVGTGFHPELTGRENTYLNGAILGMTKKEIERKFDEMVDFSGVERFIDTPVKHYSSGMRVRLAFSVAAHLDPEILLIDEVLAVGDVDFQKKCLGKMEEVASGGRSILFVSHSMAAIDSLTDKAIWLESGEVVRTDKSRQVTREYLESAGQAVPSGTVDLSRRVHASHHLQLVGIDVLRDGGIASTLEMGSNIAFRIHLNSENSIEHPLVGVGIDSADGERVVSLGSLYDPRFRLDRVRGGWFVCNAGRLPLNQGKYYVTVTISERSPDMIVDRVESACSFQVVASDVFGVGVTPKRGQGRIFWRSRWSWQPELSDQ